MNYLVYSECLSAFIALCVISPVWPVLRKNVLAIFMDVPAGVGVSGETLVIHQYT